MSYPAGLAILRCAVCRTALLVDPVNLSAMLWHYPDGAHRVVPTDRVVTATVDGEVTWPSGDALREAAQEVIGAFTIAPGVTTGRQAKALEALRALLGNRPP